MNPENNLQNFVVSNVDVDDGQWEKLYLEIICGHYNVLDQRKKASDIGVIPSEDGSGQEFIKQQIGWCFNASNRNFDQDLKPYKYNNPQKLETSLSQNCFQSPDTIQLRNYQSIFDPHPNLIAEMSPDEGYFGKTKGFPEITRSSGGEFSFDPNSTVISGILLDLYQQPHLQKDDTKPNGITPSSMGETCCCCCCGCCREPDEPNLLSL